MGFVGSSYSMEIDGKTFSFGFVNEKEAKELAIKKLDELNINFDKNKIDFRWDGSI